MEWLPVLAAQSAYVLAFVLPTYGYLPDFLGNLGGNKIIVGALVKAIPLFLLALFTLHHSSRAVSASVKTYAQYVAFGLVCGGFGDIFLDLSVKNENHFLVGLVAFLMGHLWYVVAFQQSTLKHSLAVFLPFAAYCGVLFYVLFPHLVQPKDMRVPVLIYGTVLGVMGYAAAIRTVGSARNYWFTLLGALVFIASDSILAFDKFHERIPYGKIFVMLTYYGAQNLTAAAVAPLVDADVAAAANKKDDDAADSKQSEKDARLQELTASSSKSSASSSSKKRKGAK